MAVASEAITVKGSPVRSMLKFLDAELTAEQRDELFKTLPSEYGDKMKRGTFLVTDTLPVHVLNQMTEKGAKIKDEPLDQFARRAGRFAAKEALTGVYRLFALVLTPSALLSRGGKMWSSLYSQGQMVVDKESSSHARAKLVDFPAEAAMCARISGWIEGSIEMTGAKNVRVLHDRCRAKGAADCEWEFHW